MGSSLADMRSALPGLEGWLQRVFTAMGGLIAGTGVLTVCVARVAMPSRLRDASLAIVLTRVLTVARMGAINFNLHADFRWLLLVPALVWLAGPVIHIARR